MVDALGVPSGDSALTTWDSGPPCKVLVIPALRRGTELAMEPRMAHPRRIIAGETYLVTRRCYQRTFRLRPCPDTNRVFLYCLALAAKSTGVLIHAACVMSNHHHLVVTDVRGVLPDFLRELHRLSAKALNALHGEWENLALRRRWGQRERPRVARARRGARSRDARPDPELRAP